MFRHSALLYFQPTIDELQPTRPGYPANGVQLFGRHQLEQVHQYLIRTGTGA